MRLQHAFALRKRTLLSEVIALSWLQHLKDSKDEDH